MSLIERLVGFDINNLYIGRIDDTEQNKEDNEGKVVILEKVGEGSFRAIVSGKVFKHKMLAKETNENDLFLKEGSSVESFSKYKDENHDDIYWYFGIKVGKRLTVKKIRKIEEAFNEANKKYYHHNAI